jgi:hypothetical protein
MKPKHRFHLLPSKQISVQMKFLILMLITFNGNYNNNNKRCDTLVYKCINKKKKSSMYTVYAHLKENYGNAQFIYETLLYNYIHINLHLLSIVGFISKQLQ